MTTIPKGVALEFELRDLRRILDASREMIALLDAHRRERETFHRNHPRPTDADVHVNEYVLLIARQLREVNRAACLISMGINAHDITQAAIEAAQPKAKPS